MNNTKQQAQVLLLSRAKWSMFGNYYFDDLDELLATAQEVSRLGVDFHYDEIQLFISLTDKNNANVHTRTDKS